MAESSVSIVLRSCNEAWALRDTLPALAAQHHPGGELLVFDSGSTDGSLELIRQARPRQLVQMLPREYRPGRVLNQGMALARYDRVIFLNADATPQGPDWLGPLAAALADPAVAAVFSRQIPRPDCEPAFAHDYERCFGPHRLPAAGRQFFSMASSGLRREVWARRGFRETLQYSEDDDYARACRAAGYEVRYCPASVVMHSHNYTPRQAYKRSFGEAWAAAASCDQGTKAGLAPRPWLLAWGRDAWRDLRYCRQVGRLERWPHALRLRWQQRLGRLHGFQAGWQMHRIDHVL